MSMVLVRQPVLYSASILLVMKINPEQGLLEPHSIVAMS